MTGHFIPNGTFHTTMLCYMFTCKITMRLHISLMRHILLINLFGRNDVSSFSDLIFIHQILHKRFSSLSMNKFSFQMRSIRVTCPKIIFAEFCNILKPVIGPIRMTRVVGEMLSWGNMVVWNNSIISFSTGFYISFLVQILMKAALTMTSFAETELRNVRCVRFRIL